MFSGQIGNDARTLDVAVPKRFLRFHRMRQLRRDVQNCVYAMATEDLLHARPVGYIRFNGFEIWMTILIRHNVDANDTRSVFQQPPLQNCSQESGTAGD